MSLDALIMLLGAFVALLPFLGFPNSWDRILFLVTGVLIVILGIAVRRTRGKKETPRDVRPIAENPTLDLSRHEPTQS